MSNKSYFLLFCLREGGIWQPVNFRHILPVVISPFRDENTKSHSFSLKTEIVFLSVDFDEGKHVKDCCPHHNGRRVTLRVTVVRWPFNDI